MTVAALSVPILAARELGKTRRDSERQFTVRVPALCLAPGARVALLGESGRGKSTVLSLLALATPPDEALAFAFCQHDIAAAWRRDDQALLARLRARGLSYLPQRDGLLGFLTIRENIRCAAELGRVAPDADQGHMARITASLGLTPLMDALPAALSGGQRQRAAVACALARRPRAILADEPTAALDAENARHVIQQLCLLGAELGAALVFATHQPQLLAEHGFLALQARVSSEPQGTTSVFEAAP